MIARQICWVVLMSKNNKKPAPEECSNPEPHRMYNISETVRELGVCRQVVSGLIERAGLPARRLPSINGTRPMTRIDPEDLRKWSASFKEVTKPFSQRDQKKNMKPKSKRATTERKRNWF